MKLSEEINRCDFELVFSGPGCQSTRFMGRGHSLFLAVNERDEQPDGVLDELLLRVEGRGQVRDDLLQEKVYCPPRSVGAWMGQMIDQDFINVLLLILIMSFTLSEGGDESEAKLLIVIFLFLLIES